MKKIAILGSTGSIGTQTLDVIRAHSDELEVVALAAGSNKERLQEQIREFHPELVSLSDEKKAQELKEELAAIRQQCLSSVSSDFIWHKAIVGKNDRIFLPEYQETAWRNKVDSLVHVEAAHYQQELFYEVIMNIK